MIAPGFIGEIILKSVESPKNKKEMLADTPAVDAFMAKLDHAMKPVLQALREVILATDASVGEQIKWNAPSFLYIGEMAPSDPKAYKRYIIVTNFFKQDCIRLVFPSGAKVNDTEGLLEGNYPDGRRLAHFYSLDDVEAKKPMLQQFINGWLVMVEK